MFSQIKKEIRKFFGISKTEVNGIIVLLGIQMIIFIIPFIYTPILSSRTNLDDIPVSLDSVWQVLEDQRQGRQTIDSLQDNGMHELFYFDPNTAIFSEWEKLGFDSLLAKRIIKYRNKGGVFRKPDDLKKIYGLSNQLYDRISGYIRIRQDVGSYYEVPKKKHHDHGAWSGMKENDTYKPSARQPVLFDINKVDSSDLCSIKGIGKVYASRIVKYRELLGGYYTIEQLDEVYGLKGYSLENLKLSVYVDTTVTLRQLAINFADWHELVQHPYINSDIANSLINARSEKGPFREASDLYNIREIDDSLLLKVEKYLRY